MVGERLKTLSALVLSLVSDRAKALIQQAETDFECLSRPDFFHLVHAMVKSYALAMGRKLRHAQPALTHAEARLARRQDNQEGALLVEVCRADVTRWTEGQRTYRQHLETLSLTLQPFSIDDASRPLFRALYVGTRK